MSTELLMPSNHFILCHPFILLPWIFPSLRVFSNESALHMRWARVLELQLWHQSFQWIFRVYLVLSDQVSFWIDLLAAQGTLRSLLKYHSSKASILQCSAFFMVQLLLWGNPSTMSWEHVSISVGGPVTSLCAPHDSDLHWLPVSEPPWIRSSRFSQVSRWLQALVHTPSTVWVAEPEPAS